MNQIILVDDEEDLLEAMAEMIQESLPDEKIISFTDPQLAIDKILALSHVDLLITDLTMPQMSGTELLKSVYNKAKIDNVLVLSGMGNFNDEVFRQFKCRFLEKGVATQKLISEIKLCLGNGKN